MDELNVVYVADYIFLHFFYYFNLRQTHIRKLIDDGLILFLFFSPIRNQRIVLFVLTDQLFMGFLEQTGGIFPTIEFCIFELLPELFSRNIL